MEVKEPCARYLVQPAYKQTEVGVIPEDWDIAVLNSLGKPGRPAIKAGPFGSSLIKSSYVAEGYKVYGQEQVIRGDYLYGDYYITREKFSDLRSCSIEAGDILLSLVGTAGRVLVVPLGAPEGIINPRLIRFSFDRTVISPFFFKFLFETAPYQSLLARSAQGGTMGVLNAGLLRPLPIPLPCLAEQQAIAEALSDADALVESLEQLLAKKRQIKQGAMQELLTGQKRMPGFSGKWAEMRLGDSAALKARIGWQGLTTAEYKESGNFYLVTGTEFSNGYINWNNCFFIDEGRYKQDKNIQLRLHDVLVTKDGTIGKVALIDQLPMPATLNSGVFVIRPIEKAFHPEFFYHLLCSEMFGDFLAQLSAGSTISHLYQKDFVGFVFRAPKNIAEQTAIAAILTDMDAELAALEAKLAKARQLKQGMMQELLTGRIRLLPARAEVIPLPVPENAKMEKPRQHNRQIEEAVMLGVLAKAFGSEQNPLARVRRTKLLYLLHRHIEGRAEGYLKKAAGPYNPKTRYQGAEGIAVKNAYVRSHRNGTWEGFVAGDKVVEAEAYFDKWYEPAVRAWLEQFHYVKTEELELLATVDMAMEDLRRAGNPVTLAAVKQIIASHPEWQAKLEKPIFSDANIERAITKCHNLFGN